MQELTALHNHLNKSMSLSFSFTRVAIKQCNWLSKYTDCFWVSISTTVFMYAHDSQQHPWHRMTGATSSAIVYKKHSQCLSRSPAMLVLLPPKYSIRAFPLQSASFQHVTAVFYLLKDMKSISQISCTSYKRMIPCLSAESLQFW